VTQLKLLLEPELDLGGSIGDLAGHKLESTARRFVVEEDAAAGEHPVALPVVDGDVVPVDLGDAVGGSRVEGGELGLGRLAHLSEHLAARGLVEADVGVDGADGLQHANHAKTCDLTGEERLLEAEPYETDGAEVVHLGGLAALECRHQRRMVEQVTLDELDAGAETRHRLETRIVLSAHQSVDVVARREQHLPEVGAILTGDAGDEGCARHARSPRVIAGAARRRLAQRHAKAPTASA